MFKNQIKCVIWDLDETVWDGSLAEKDTVKPREDIINIIADLDKKGIINSICSKNDYDDTKSLLEKLNIWDYFVFSVIDFVPKGKSVKNIIEQLQLRDENVLFVDDNTGNRNEVKYYCDKIMVADVNEDDFIKDITSVITQASGASRLERYKILEKKAQAKNNYIDNTDFLKDSEITVCILRNPADLTFKER